MAQTPYSPPNPTLQTITDLLTRNHDAFKARFEDMQRDLAEKHEENKKRRHDLAGMIDATIGRVWKLESRVDELQQRVFSVVGDGTGETGLLHKIDDSVNQLASDVKSFKMVLVFIGVGTPIGCAILFGVLQLVLRK